MRVDPAELRRVAGHFATGVMVLTAEHEGRPCGLTVNAFMTVSLEPPLVLVSIGRGSRSLPCVEGASRFALSILAEGQEEISRLFASKDEDKLGKVRTQAGQSGMPLLEGAIAHLECRTARRVEGGDHVLFLAEVEAVRSHAGSPLLFYQGRYTATAGPPAGDDR